jgi:hypothetical protein
MTQIVIPVTGSRDVMDDTIELEMARYTLAGLSIDDLC